MMSSGLKKLIHILILAALYVGGLFLASFFLNFNSDSSARSVKLTDRELPVLFVQTDDGNAYNYLNGYKNAMDIRYIHDALGVIGSRASDINFKVEGYSDENLRIDYELTDFEGRNIYERREIGPSSVDEDGMLVEIPVKSIVSEDKELMLHIMLYQNHDNPIHYYMRIQQGYSRLIDNYISYINEFVDFCIRKEKKIAQYIEPDPRQDNSSLANVNIHSSYENITFGHLKPQRNQPLQIELCEFNDDVAMFRCRYLLDIDYEKDEPVQLEVSETYRVRQGNDRVILLNFERRIGEVFKLTDKSFGKNTLNLGITANDFEYLASVSGDRIFFKKNRKLWAYNNASGNLTELTLWMDSSMFFDDRYNIKLLDMDPSGNVNFIVYGYIPSGEHEGMNGIILYQYDPDLNSVVERLEIHSDRSYPYLKHGVDNLTYLGADNKFYIDVGDKIYSLDLAAPSRRDSTESFSAQSVQVSESKRYLAYVNNGTVIEEGIRSFDSIYIKDLLNASVDKIEAGEGSSILPLGFLGDDLIYGEYHLNDLAKDRFGKALLPAKKIRIVSVSGELKKEYSSGKNYIRDISISDSNIELYRLKKKDGRYIDISNDRIIYSKSTARESVELKFESQDDQTRKKQGILVLPNRIAGGTHRILKPVLTVDTDAGMIRAEGGEPVSSYYVFHYNNITQVHHDLISAINYASEHIGAVVDIDKGTVWQRTTYSEPYVVDYDSIDERYHSIKKIDSAIEGKDALQPLNNVHLNDILYFVKHNIPVLAYTEEKGRLLIVGYDNYNIIMRAYNETGEMTEEFFYGKKDSEELFDRNNNRFMFLR